MKKFAKKAIRELFNHSVRRHYDKAYRRLLKLNNILNKPCEGEDKWIEKWSVLGKANPIYYRLFSHYIGNNINIIPEDICRNIVEPILDPLRYVSYYSDKNIFDRLFRQGTLPKTIFRKMSGFYYDSEYNSIKMTNDSALKDILQLSGCNKIIIKPSVDSSSGNGIKLFEKKDNEWIEIGGDGKLTLAYLDTNYGDDIVVQECVEQAEFMSYFNSTSVNTLRLTLYRSVKTNECHIPSAIIRIGASGSLVDNAHAGGGCVGIKVEDGTLCNKVLNQYGESTTEFNGIDFTKEHKIPNWDKVVEFAKYIGRNIPHHRLLALDIMLDKKGCPRLIEYNIKSCSVWLFQLTSSSVFGEFTDEVIGYCKNNLDKAQMVITL